MDPWEMLNPNHPLPVVKPEFKEPMTFAVPVECKSSVSKVNTLNKELAKVIYPMIAEERKALFDMLLTRVPKKVRLAKLKLGNANADRMVKQAEGIIDQIRVARGTPFDIPVHFRNRMGLGSI